MAELPPRIAQLGAELARAKSEIQALRADNRRLQHENCRLLTLQTAQSKSHTFCGSLSLSFASTAHHIDPVVILGDTLVRFHPRLHRSRSDSI